MPEFISLLLWLPNFPDLNPADYNMWSVVQEKMYKTDLDDLKHRIRIRTEWAKPDHAIIVAAVCLWRHHLSPCVRVDGGHLQHCF